MGEPMGEGVVFPEPAPAMTSRGGAASPAQQCSTACHCSDLRKVANGFRQRVAEKSAHMRPERPRSDSLKGIRTPNCTLKSIGVLGCHLSEKPLKNSQKRLTSKLNTGFDSLPRLISGLSLRHLQPDDRPARHASVGSTVVKSSAEPCFGEAQVRLVGLVSTESHFHPAYLSPV